MGGGVQKANAGKQVQEVLIGNFIKVKSGLTIDTKDYVLPQGLQCRCGHRGDQYIRGGELALTNSEDRSTRKGRDNIMIGPELQ